MDPRRQEEMEGCSWLDDVVNDDWGKVEETF